MPQTAEIKISLTDIEPMKELYRTVHSMLVARLLHGQDSREFLEAINEVITAHDAIADRIDDA